MSDFFINYYKKPIAESLTTQILANSNAFAFHKAQPYYSHAPLYSLPALAKTYALNNIYIKDESARFGLQSFKAMGASYAIHRILPLHFKTQVFCTATDGNHGRSVAWAARLAGKKSVVYMPKGTASSRIQAIAQEGAQVVVVAGNYEEASRLAKSKSQQEGWTLVQDAASEGYEEIPAYIMAGYITHFKELEEDFAQLCIPQNVQLNMSPNKKDNQNTQATAPNAAQANPLAPEVIFLQAGVGTWAAVAIWYYITRYTKLYKAQQHADNTPLPRLPKFVIVEPLEADGILQSFKEATLSSPKGNYTTIMAGLNCGRPSSTAWNIIQSCADISIRISDVFAERAIRILYYPKQNDAQIMAGESGASGLAGLLAVLEIIPEVRNVLGIGPQSNILLFNTEGPTDPNNFKKIVKAQSLANQNK